MIKQRMANYSDISCVRFAVTLLAIFFSLAGYPALSEDAQDLVGKPMPYFRIVSGDDHVLTPDMIKGKIIILFYETKDASEINQPFKDELNKLYDNAGKTEKNILFKLPVINCTSAFWPFTPIWENQLIKVSKQKYLTIYGDWDGNMIRDYGFVDNDSNLMLIDKLGIIRYYAHGKIQKSESERIKAMLLELLNPKSGPKLE